MPLLMKMNNFFILISFKFCGKCNLNLILAKVKFYYKILHLAEPIVNCVSAEILVAITPVNLCGVYNSSR